MHDQLLRPVGIKRALPRALRALKNEPRWIAFNGAEPGSAEWTEKIADVSASIHNVPKDALYGMHLRESRRRVRHLSAAGALGVILLVTGLVAALIAGQKTELALAGQLAARSAALLATDLPQAQLLAVQAYRRAPNAETTAALFGAVTATPQAVGYLDAGQEVTAVASARSADVVVAGTASGDVLRWAGGARQVIGHTDAPTQSVSVSDDGAVVSLTGGAQALLWAGGRLSAVDLGDDRTAGPTAVSPSGHTALFDAVTTRDLDGSGPPQGDIVSVDLPTSRHATFALPGRWAQLYAPKDGAIVAAAEDGTWWRRAADGSADVAGSVYLGAHSQASAISPDGRYFTYSNGAVEVPVWDTGPGDADPDRPAHTASVPGGDRQALAISPDGRRLAASDAGSVYLSDIGSAPTEGPALTLAGNATVTALQFVSDDVLIGATGRQVVTWGLARTSRIASDTVQAAVPIPCNGCPGVDVAVRPDGQAVAVVAGSYGLIVRLDGPRPAAATFTATDFGVYAGAVWSSDGSLILPVAANSPTLDAELRSPGDGQLLGSWPVARDATAGVLGLARASDGTIFDVDGVGRVLVRDPRSGEVLRTVPAPTVTPVEQRQQVEDHAVSAEIARAAVISGGMLRLIELDSGRSTIVTTDAKDVAFAGGSLIVRLTNGRVQVRDASDGRLLHEAPGLPLVQYFDKPTTNGQMIAEVTTDGTLRLADVGNGSRIGSFPLDPSFDARKAGLAFSPDGASLVVASPRGVGAAMERLARPLGRGRVQARWPGPDAGRVGLSGRLGKSRPALPSVRRTRPDAPAPSGSTTRVKQTPSGAPSGGGPTLPDMHRVERR